MNAAVAARRLASPAVKAQLRRRGTELLSLVLALLGLALLVSLVSHDPSDPSLNTATGRAPHNLAGPFGAVASDLLLQGAGLAAALPGLALLSWAWRLASQHTLPRPALRIIALLLAVPATASCLALLPGLRWPTEAGLGGAGGRVIAEAISFHAQSVFGPMGVLGAGVAMVGATAGLFLAAMALTPGEWRLAGSAIGTGARGAVGAARRGRGFFSRVLSGLRRRRPEAEPRAEVPVRLVLPRTPMLPDAPAESPASASVVVPVRTPRVAPPAKRPAPVPKQEVLPLSDQWRLPPLSLLKPPPSRQSGGPSADALQANARLLEQVLQDYGVEGRIVEIRPGPVVTLYELEPAPGIRAARVVGLADDVARSLSVMAVRIATVPGRNVLGIEVPNARRETVFLSELLTSEAWEQAPGRLNLALGKDIGGTPVVVDLARMPHLLIAGTTGSGKSVGINTMILSLLFRLSPEHCRLVMIDPKMLELSVYEGIPHLLAPVVTEPAKAVVALKWTVREMERRNRAMSQLGVRNIAGYNERVAEAQARGEVVTRRVQTGFDPETGRPMFEDQPLALEKMPFIVVVIDEMADLMMVAGKEIEAAVQRLAQMARAAGIHVIMATQRPSVDVITGVIKANFPARISFQVTSKFDSRTILQEQGAEQLLGQGDMLVMQGGGRLARVHGPFVSDREVEEVVAFLRSQGEPDYVEEVTEPPDDDASGADLGIAGASDGEKGLFDQAVALVAREGKASTSFIQRHLGIGYNRAAKLIEQMEKEGIVGAANHVGKREVLVRRTEREE